MIVRKLLGISIGIAHILVKQVYQVGLRYLDNLFFSVSPPQNFRHQLSRPGVSDHIHRSVITSAYYTESVIPLVLCSLCLLSVFFNVSEGSKGHSFTLLIQIILVVQILWVCSYLNNWKDMKKCSLCSWAPCFSNVPAALSATI